MHTAGGGMGEGVGDTAAVADDIQTFMEGLQGLIDFHFHIVKFDFYTLEEGIVICCTGGDFIQCVYHFDDAIK